MSDTRTLNVDYLARVEGEGALTIRTRGVEVEEVALRIFEPPRFFEAFLRGRRCTEVPDITARICGICPAAYQMSACKAVENALGIAVHSQVEQLRRLLYCGEWIESHALHMVMLHAPDFLGLPDAAAMAAAHGQQVRDGLRVKKAGNAIVAAAGGREIHPVNVRVGGFHRLPARSELSPLLGEIEACRGLAEGLVRWMAGFAFPELHRTPELVALRPASVYPFAEGDILSSTGLRADVSAFADHFEEVHVARSNALHSRRVGGGAYLTGPLARFNLDFDRLPDRLRALAADIGVLPPVTNPFRSILVRGIELLYAFEEASRIVRQYEPPAAASAPLGFRAGVGHGATEAPRGLLYHRYEIDGDGIVRDAKIVPPTAQNLATMEDDLRALAPVLVELDDERATLLAEQAVRNHDPCISCATHFLRLTRVRG